MRSWAIAVVSEELYMGASLVITMGGGGRRLMITILKKALFWVEILLLAMCFGCSEIEDDREDSYVYLYIEPKTIQIYNAENKYIKIANGDISKNIKPIDVISQNEYECIIEVPCSEVFTFEGFTDTKVKCGVFTSMDRKSCEEYTVTGVNIASMAISPEGELLISGDNFSFEVFGSMQGELLGPYGNLRLSGMAESSVKVQFDSSTNTVSFDGVIPETAFVSINGNMHVNTILASDYECGTIDLSNLADGTITVIGISGESNTIDCP